MWKDEVYCVPADGSKKPRQLTAGARGTGVTHGLADFLAREELDRYEGTKCHSDIFVIFGGQWWYLVMVCTPGLT